MSATVNISIDGMPITTLGADVNLEEISRVVDIDPESWNEDESFMNFKLQLAFNILDDVRKIRYENRHESMEAMSFYSRVEQNRVVEPHLEPAIDDADKIEIITRGKKHRFSEEALVDEIDKIIDYVRDGKRWIHRELALYIASKAEDLTLYAKLAHWIASLQNHYERVQLEEARDRFDSWKEARDGISGELKKELEMYKAKANRMFEIFGEEQYLELKRKVDTLFRRKHRANRDETIESIAVVRMTRGNYKIVKRLSDTFDAALNAATGGRPIRVIFERRGIPVDLNITTKIRERSRNKAVRDFKVDHSNIELNGVFTEQELIQTLEQLVDE